MHVRLQPPQPRRLIGKLVERCFDGQEFGTDCSDDAAQLYPRLPFLFLQRQDSLRMTLDRGIGQNIRQLRFTHRFLLWPTSAITAAGTLDSAQTLLRPLVHRLVREDHHLFRTLR